MNNPLSSYRRIQRELRRHYDSFTKDHCMKCPTPCCRQPARILPTDILLAEATGWKSNLPKREGEAEGDLSMEMAARFASAMVNAPASAEDEVGDAPPCEFLGEKGCSFPIDLRPFGCTAYICRYMHAGMERKTLAKVKRLVRELEEAHTILMRKR